jgi:hypothetical protein
MEQKFYCKAWQRIRAKRHHEYLEDELLWHKVYEEYISLLPWADLETRKDGLIEAHLRIVPKIAGRIAWKRCPKSFGIWARGQGQYSPCGPSV